MILFRMCVCGDPSAGQVVVHCIALAPCLIYADAMLLHHVLRTGALLGYQGCLSVLFCLSNFFFIPCAGGWFSSGFFLALLTLTRVNSSRLHQNTKISGGSHNSHHWTSCTAPYLNCIHCLLGELQEASKRTELAINQSSRRPKSHRSECKHSQLQTTFRDQGRPSSRGASLIQRKHGILLL